MKSLKVIAEQCTGCDSCVLSCSFQHGDTFGMELSRILVERQEESAVFKPQVCIQCAERFCIQGCPQEALSVHPVTGAIQVSEERCTGCRQCEQACPFGGMHFVEGTRMPFVCDLCGGDPECVKACQKPGALVFVEKEGEEHDV